MNNVEAGGPGMLEMPDGPAIAYHRETPASDRWDRPGVVWLGGFKSTMDGTKAQSLAAWARRTGHGFIRFDYSGHGLSEGKFGDGTISRWLAESEAVFNALTSGPQVLVGSSMGGWIALLLARRHIASQSAAGTRLAGLVLIAPAVDMTERLIWKNASPEVRHQIETEGVYLRPSDYGDGPYPITRNLIEDGKKHLMLGSSLEMPCPVHILHGQEDPDVPWRLSLEIADMIDGEISVEFIKNGDHRLSRPQDIRRLENTVAFLADQFGTADASL